jgi:hypothetical protein
MPRRLRTAGAEQRRNVPRVIVAIVVMLLALGGLMIWAAW